jgi:hypothetical protein
MNRFPFSYGLYCLFIIMKWGGKKLIASLSSTEYNIVYKGTEKTVANQMRKTKVIIHFLFIFFW